MNWVNQFWGKRTVFEEEGRKENNFKKGKKKRKRKDETAV